MTQQDMFGAVDDGAGPGPLVEFDKQFWPCYPRRMAKKQARKAFLRARKIASLADIMDGLEKWKASDQWRDPQFIPLPASWLNGERWEDEMQVDGIMSANPSERRGGIYGTNFIIGEE